MLCYSYQGSVINAPRCAIPMQCSIYANTILAGRDIYCNAIPTECNISKVSNVIRTNRIN